VIVLDASFLVAFHNERDAHHLTARTLMEAFLAEKWGRGLLLEYVFLEVVTVLLVRRDVATARQVGRILLEAQELEFIPCSDFFRDTWNAFAAQRGTRLSFTDAAIHAVAKERAAGQVLTFDEEFRKVPGLLVLPAEDGSGQGKR
jgi:predicted nucleic acid-binding protein